MDVVLGAAQMNLAKDGEVVPVLFLQTEADEQMVVVLENFPDDGDEKQLYLTTLGIALDSTGRTVEEAIREMADRVDVEELRSLAAVITQSERFGASLVKALRIHSEHLRAKRLQRAEEMGQKAVVKLLIPTILLIFPAMFVVVLGPPTMQIVKMIEATNRVEKAAPPPP